MTLAGKRARLPGARGRGARCGQALIESCLALVLVCLLLSGLFQVAQVFQAQEILNYAAGRAARAKTVGFNRWMVQKCARTAAIPNAGPITVPESANVDPDLRRHVADDRPGILWDWAVRTEAPVQPQFFVETARVPEFLAAENAARAYNILDYRDWNSVQVSHSAAWGDGLLRATVRQSYPLLYPMHRAFYDADSVDLQGESRMESHYSLYLEDHGW
jgi:hypothetical protein